MKAGSIGRGLYAITDRTACGDIPLTAAVEQALRGGARVIQYRDKQQPAAVRAATAADLVTLCRRYAVPLIINDDVALAAACGADGIHLGRADCAPDTARRRLGETAIIGVSCYNSLERAQRAAAAGADYVAFGRFYPSLSKPGATTAGIGLLRQARPVIDVPVVAIGGITPDNGAQLLDAGADLLAAIHGVFGQPDIEAAARRYRMLFNLN